MNTKVLALGFGITFILVGLIGFFPNPLVAANGLFAVNAAHNLVHLVTGAVFLLAALKFATSSAAWIKAVGFAYAAVAVLGFIPALFSGEHLLGIVHINQADKWLHVGLAIVILLSAYLVPPYPTRSAVR